MIKTLNLMKARFVLDCLADDLRLYMIYEDDVEMHDCIVTTLRQQKTNWRKECRRFEKQFFNKDVLWDFGYSCWQVSILERAEYHLLLTKALYRTVNNSAPGCLHTATTGELATRVSTKRVL